jgi:TolB-like protein
MYIKNGSSRGGQGTRHKEKGQRRREKGKAILRHTGTVQPSPDEIRQQLDRLLASEGFANTERMRGFLRYVVNRALAGESSQIKEYVIGIEVFGRDQSYDPRLDAIVRVEARRLRSKIDEYYSGEGREDPVVIQLRRGSYVPVFVRRPGALDASLPAASPKPDIGRTRPGWRFALALAAAALVLVAVTAMRGGLWATGARPAPSVSVAVLPFAEYSTETADKLLAARLTDGVTSELARIGTIGVVSHTSALQFAGGPRRPAKEIGQLLNADVVMEGSVSRQGDRIEVKVRLVNAVADRKMWVEDFVGTASDPRELERRIASGAAPAVLAFRRP